MLIQMYAPGASDNRSKAPEVSSIASNADFPFVAPLAVSDVLSRAPSTQSLNILSQASSCQTLNREALGHSRPGTPIRQSRLFGPQGKRDLSRIVQIFI